MVLSARPPDCFHDPTSLHTIQLSGQPPTVGQSCQDVCGGLKHSLHSAPIQLIKSFHDGDQYWPLGVAPF